MIKLMVFIDGSWLYHGKYKLGGGNGSDDYALDYGKLPQALADQLAGHLGGRDTDVVRTYLFASCAANYDARDEEIVQRQKDFFSMLKEKYHYEVEVFPVDFRGRRLRRADRRPDDAFEPRERGVDVALAGSLMYYAALPDAFDIAVVVLGEEDFVPVLQLVRRLGKRVAVASIRSCCCEPLSDPYDEARVKDFDILWLDDMVGQLELGPSRPRPPAPPRANSTGRERLADSDSGFGNGANGGNGARVRHPASDPGEPIARSPLGQTLKGAVKTKFEDRGYGFIRGTDNLDYFFHVTDLQGGLLFQDVHDGLEVTFEVKKLPEYNRAGAAMNVRAIVPDWRPGDAGPAAASAVLTFAPDGGDGVVPGTAADGEG